MSDKVLVDRELLEQISMDLAPYSEPAKELRTLLSAQPQASAAQSQAGQEKVNAEPYFLDGRIKGYTIDKDEYLRVSREYASAAQSAPDDREALQRLLDDVRDVRNADDVAFGWHEAAEQLGAAWQRTQSAPVVPEGWRLVPAEPTEDMMVAAMKCYGNDDDCYRAMLAAAPQPAARQEQGDVIRGMHYQVLFNAIAAATSVSAGKGSINISVQAFKDSIRDQAALSASAEGKA